MKESIYPHSLGPALDQYGEAEGIIDGDYRSSWNAHAGRGSARAFAARAPDRPLL